MGTSNTEVLRVFIDLAIMKKNPQFSLTALDKAIWMLQEKDTGKLKLEDCTFSAVHLITVSFIQMPKKLLPRVPKLLSKNQPALLENKQSTSIYLLSVIGWNDNIQPAISYHIMAISCIPPL